MKTISATWAQEIEKCLTPPTSSERRFFVNGRAKNQSRGLSTLSNRVTWG
jgi:hypothetical protein